MLFSPQRIPANPATESNLTWSVLQSSTDSTLGLNKNVGVTIVDGSDPNAYFRSGEARYSYSGRYVAVRRANSPGPLDVANIIDFYDENGTVIKSLEIGQSPSDLVTDWMLDLDNNVYTVGDTAVDQVVKTDFATNIKTFISLTVPTGVAPVQDPRYITYEPANGMIIAEATRSPGSEDENLYVFDLDGTYAGSRRVGDTTSSQGLIGANSAYNIFVNYNGTNVEVWLLLGLVPQSGWPITIGTLAPEGVDMAINQDNDIFIHFGTEIFKYNTAGALVNSQDIDINYLNSTMNIDQFNNIWVTDEVNGVVKAINQNDLSTKWTRSIPNVTTTVGDFLPIGSKTNWN